MRVRWTRPAFRDLDAIGKYIARDSPIASAEVVTAILDHADMLAAQPHLGRAGRITDTRELVVSNTPFIVVYLACCRFHGHRV